MNAATPFAHIGMNHIVQTSRVLCIMRPGTKSARRYLDLSKDRGMFIDASVGRSFRSILLMDDGTVIASCISPMTLLKRFTLTSDELPTDAAADDAMDLIEVDGEDDEE